MGTLVLLRHGESEWNSKGLFTGWVDVGLAEKGRQEAAAAGRMLVDAGLRPDVVHTSVLTRAISTANVALEAAGLSWLPVSRSWRLNERHYGALQGKDKAQTREEFGDEQFMTWRRSYDVPPPGGESLKDTLARALPYYVQEILPGVLNGKRTLVAAHGNSLRALIMVLEKLSPEGILKRELATGVPIIYRLNADSTVASKLDLAG
jgi:2,3-bisphosphoglycerate-dependent phosphoglycerate mutase